MRGRRGALRLGLPLILAVVTSLPGAPTPASVEARSRVGRIVLSHSKLPYL